MSSALPRSLPRPSCSSSSSCSSTSRSIRRSLSTTPFRRNQHSTPPDLAPPIASSSQLHQRPPPPPLHHHPSPPPPPPSSSTPTSSTSEPRFVPLDIQDFLRGYPLFRKNRWNQLNALFYANEQLATPSDWTIEDLLSRLRKNPELLRDDHAAFEWLFPLPERSGNLECWRLEPHETQAISTNPLQMNRLIRAYDAALRIYGITLVDRESGLLRANSTFKDRITHLPTTPSQTLRLTRILKSLTVLSPLPPSPLSVLHHIPSLILFLLAHHNDPHSPLDLSPNTPGGEALEMRWGMCIRNKAFREMVQGMIGSRRGTTAEDGGGENWGVKEYENWVVSRSTTSSSSEQEEEAEGGPKKKKTITIAEAVKRGVSSRAKESEWLDSQATKRAFLTPSGVSLKRRQPVGANSDSNPAGGVFDAEAWMEDEEEEGKRRQEGEWEEVVSYAAEESLGEGEGGEGEGAEVEEKWEEEEKELDLEGAIGRVLEREDDEDEEGWEREVGVTGGEGKKKD